MKNFILILFIIYSCISFSQNHEFAVNYRIGISTSSFKKIEPAFNTNSKYRWVKTLYDHGLTINYKYKFWKKYNWFISGGFEFSQSRHYMQMIDYKSYYHLDNIEINKNRNTIKLGISKQFHFYEKKVILDLSFNIIKRFYGETQIDYIKEFTFSENQPWIEYKYELNTFYSDEYIAVGAEINSTFNAEINANIKFKLKNNLYLNAGLNYTRNNIFFYDYTYSINYYQNGSSIPVSSYTYIAVWPQKNAKFGIDDDFIYFNLGLSYKFNWKK